MGALTWTTEKPTKPGWYWFRTLVEPDPEVVWVFEGRGPGLGAVSTNGWTVAVRKLIGEWAGPIEAPP